jgi:hypothetical protein
VAEMVLPLLLLAWTVCVTVDQPGLWLCGDAGDVSLVVVVRFYSDSNPSIRPILLLYNISSRACAPIYMNPRRHQHSFVPPDRHQMQIQNQWWSEKERRINDEYITEKLCYLQLSNFLFLT